MSKRHHSHQGKKRYVEKGNKKNQKKGDKPITLTGKISITPGGYGFVAVAEENFKGDVFVPPKYVESAMTGDIVEIELAEDERRREGEAERGPVGKVSRVLERARSKLVGEVVAGRKVRPLDKRIPEDIRICGNFKGAKKGDWVEIELFHKEKMTAEGRRGQILENIGKAGRIESDLRAVIKEFDLPPAYTEEQNEEAEELEPAEIAREDLTDLFCVTIDPEDAKDFDDSVSLRPGANPGEVELGVHIADVAAWIRPGSKWDAEAAKRSFTAYLPGKTLPMLPRTLTRKISLMPGKKSLTHSVLFTVEKATGKILRSRRVHGLVSITKRLNFDEVQSFIDGRIPSGWDKGFCEKMREIVDLGEKMRLLRRKEEVFLELATTEIRVLCNELENLIIGLKKEVQSESDKLVEDCMLAANSEVAKELISRQIPGMFRVHPEPEPDKLEEFAYFVKESFDMSTGDLTSREACNHFLKSLPEDHKKAVIINAFLRSLPRAYYLHEPALHFGLGKEKYSHFTSPIRRYPDLLVHQQLWAKDTNAALKSKKTLEDLALECSKKEQNNDEAYYSANDRLKLQYLEQRIDENNPAVHEGVISKITSAGLLVEVEDIGIYGLVPREELPGQFKYKKGGQKLRATRGHTGYKCGDFIYLYLDRIDFIKGKAIFRPVQ